MTQTAHLTARDVGVRFGDIQVLSGVDLDIHPGEVHGLIGENGAGKSTLGKVLGGYYRATFGDIFVEGQRQSRWDTPTALSNGIAIMHQELQLVPALTVAQNVYLGIEDHRAGVLRNTEAARLRKLMDDSGLALEPDEITSSLTIADQQKIEILRALARDARVIVMDEPTSSLSKSEVKQLHRIMKSLRDEGRSVIYVTHFLDDVLDVCDRITVLRNGQMVHTRDRGTETKETLISAMLGGEKAETLYPPKPIDFGAVALSVTDLRSSNGSKVESLQVRAGEIVGFAGLIGAGRSEIVRAIVGADSASGRVEVNGVAIATGDIQASTRAGLVMVPEDRRGQGLVMTLPVRANMTLPHLVEYSHGGVVSNREERTLATRLIERFSVRPAIVDGDVSNYSGGNQQKILLGKWIARNPCVLILDEPSRGVDIGAREKIHEEISRLAAEGVAILVISSELNEVLGLANKVCLIDRGQIVAEVDPNRASEADVLATLFKHQGKEECVA